MLGNKVQEFKAVTFNFTLKILDFPDLFWDMNTMPS